MNFQSESTPTNHAPRKDVISRVRPRFETGYVLTTRHTKASISNPTEAADVLRETAADADCLRDTLDDWITGHYGIADNKNGELLALRCIVGNMCIAMTNAAHVLDKCAGKPITWHGLGAREMAALLDDYYGSGAIDPDTLAEFKEEQQEDNERGFPLPEVF